MKFSQSAIEKLKSTFAERLRQSRKSLGYTQETLAERCNEVETMTISRWERCKTVPSIDQLAIVACVLHVKTDWLLGIENNQPYEDRRYKKVMAKLQKILEEGE